MTTRTLARALVATMITLTATAQESTEQDAPWYRFETIGDTITVWADQQGDIILSDSESDIEVEEEWRALPSGRHAVRFTIPQTIQPGAFALKLRTRGVTHNLPLTVHALKKLPRNLRLWLEPPENDTTVETEPGTLNILLNLSNDPVAETQWPLINSSHASLRDTLPRRIRIGQYSLLVFDITDHSNRALGKLHRMRRNLKDSQATIAISLTRGPDIPFRTQSILFVDDPVQALILPQATTGEDVEHLTRWSSIPIIEAGIKSRIDITPSGITPK